MASSSIEVARITNERRQHVRILVVGLGTVGQWLLRALDSGGERLARRYGVGFTVVGVANAHDGFIYDGGWYQRHRQRGHMPSRAGW